MPNPLKQLKRRTHWVSIKQYNTNISIYTKQKCWRALQSLQDNYSMHSICLHRLTWKKFIENLFLELRWKWLADSLTDACGHVLGFRSLKGLAGWIFTSVGITECEHLGLQPLAGWILASLLWRKWSYATSPSCVLSFAGFFFVVVFLVHKL